MGSILILNPVLNMKTITHPINFFDDIVTKNDNKFVTFVYKNEDMASPTRSFPYKLEALANNLV